MMDLLVSGGVRLCRHGCVSEKLAEDVEYVVRTRAVKDKYHLPEDTPSNGLDQKKCG